MAFAFRPVPRRAAPQAPILTVFRQGRDTRICQAVISTSEPPLLLKCETVTSFAPVFHERATNAVKYGTLASAGGHLAIDVGIEPETVTIEWREESACAPQETESGTGFGSKLPETIVEGRFRGTLERIRISGGIQLNLHLPASLFAMG